MLARTSLTYHPTLTPPHFSAARLAGDTDQEGLEGLDSADIICATPEKFDATTRRGMRFFADIGLVLIGKGQAWARAGRLACRQPLSGHSREKSCQ